MINWTRFARSHNVTGGNAGQVVKELAKRNGIDVEKLDHRMPLRRLRSSKHKLAYGVSVPCNPTVTALKSNIVELVQAGKLSVGEPCSPYTLRQMTFDKGKLVESSQSTVEKFHLLN